MIKTQENISEDECPTCKNEIGFSRFCDTCCEFLPSWEEDSEEVKND